MTDITGATPVDAGAVGVSLAEPRDYFALMKPRVMSLVVFTAFVGLAMAPGSINPVIAAVALLAIAVGAGASGALNMWYDADIDRVMTRTAVRPIPSGRVSPTEALQFGMVFSVMSVFTLGVLVGWVAAALLAFTIFFYVVVYTMWLKRSTPQNIVIGGAAGAFPPMIGWAAVTGGVSVESIVLFLIIFFWTPPHFWALALVKSDDYARAGVPMMPVAMGEATTRRQILLYAVVLVAVSLAPCAVGIGGVLYGTVAAVLGAVFLALSVQVLRITEGAPARKAAIRLFLFSIAYLFALFAVLPVERLLATVLGS